MEEHSGLRALIERFLLYRVRAAIHPAGKRDDDAVSLTIVCFCYNNRHGSTHYFSKVAKADDLPYVGKGNSVSIFHFRCYTRSNDVLAIPDI